MRERWTSMLLLIALLGASLGSPSHAQDMAGIPLGLAIQARGDSVPPPAAHPVYFYRGLGYGSESLVSPLRLIINGGFGILQFDNRSDRLGDVDFERGFRNVTWNLSHAGTVIEQDGWGDFLQREVIPVSVNTNNAQYWPNYTLHLIGGGMSYRMMLEWFRHHDFQRPTLWAVGTIGVYHFLNEVVEASDDLGPSTDAIADLYLFDPASMVLFSFEGVNRFFSHTLHMQDWSHQPGLDLRRGEIINQGQNFSIKLGIPWWERMSLFYYFGTHGEGGLSFRHTGTDAISIAGGLRAKELVDLSNGTRTVELAPSVGFFYDREGSLLASVLWSETSSFRLRANLYPGVLRMGLVSPGLFFGTNQSNAAYFGIDLRIPAALPFGFATSIDRED